MYTQDRARRLDRREILRAGTGLAALLASEPLLAQPAATPIGAVEAIRGEAQAEQAGNRRTLKAGGEILVGDLLSTGEAALLVMRLGPATTIKLGANARLRIDRYLADVGGELDMQAGHLMFERRGKPTSQGLIFRSAYGLLAVRGTSFTAGPNRGRFAVLVTHGLVEVTAGGRSVMVGLRQGTDIDKPGAPPSRPALWKAARVRELQANLR